MIDWPTILRLAAAFPGSEESTSYGTPALRVAKKAYLRLHQSEEAIVLRLNDPMEQQAFIEDDPDHFYLTDHYQGTAWVLVKPTIPENELQEIMEIAWRRVARHKDVAAFDESE